MTFKKIVGFGDSWVWGDELLDPSLISHPHAHPVLVENTQYRESNCFIGQLGQHYGVPIENFGIPGGSLQSTIWNYLWWLENSTETEDCLVLVGLTDAARTSYYNPNHVSYSNDPPWNRYVHGAWARTKDTCYSSDWVQMIKQQTVLSDCSKLHNLNYKQAVLFFEGQASMRNGHVLQFCTISPPYVENSKSLLWPEGTLDTLIKNEHDYTKYYAPGRHPNELGHKLIAKHLISQIDSCIM